MVFVVKNFYIICGLRNLLGVVLWMFFLAQASYAVTPQGIVDLDPTTAKARSCSLVFFHIAQECWSENSSFSDDDIKNFLLTSQESYQVLNNFRKKLTFPMSAIKGRKSKVEAVRKRFFKFNSLEYLALLPDINFSVINCEDMAAIINVLTVLTNLKTLDLRQNARPDIPSIFISERTMRLMSKPPTNLYEAPRFLLRYLVVTAFDVLGVSMEAKVNDNKTVEYLAEVSNSFRNLDILKQDLRLRLVLGTEQRILASFMDAMWLFSSLENLDLECFHINDAEIRTLIEELELLLQAKLPELKYFRLVFRHAKLSPEVFSALLTQCEELRQFENEQEENAPLLDFFHPWKKLDASGRISDACIYIYVPRVPVNR